jgi:hypothetical protein
VNRQHFNGSTRITKVVRPTTAIASESAAVIVTALLGPPLSIAVMFLVPCCRSLMACLYATGSVVAMSVAFRTFGFGLAPALVMVVHPAGSGHGRVAIFDRRICRERSVGPLHSASVDRRFKSLSASTDLMK